MPSQPWEVGPCVAWKGFAAAYITQGRGLAAGSSASCPYPWPLTNLVCRRLRCPSCLPHTGSHGQSKSNARSFKKPANQRILKRQPRSSPRRAAQLWPQVLGYCSQQPQSSRQKLSCKLCADLHAAIQVLQPDSLGQSVAFVNFW